MKIEEKKDEKSLEKIKFKPFDKVRALSGHYCDYTKGSIYNLPRTPGTVIECSAGYVTIDYNGIKSPPVHPDYFEIVEEWKEEKMPRFHVGDFVTAYGWSNPKGHEIVRIDSKSYWLNTDIAQFPYSIDEWDSKLRLVTQTPKSPVVEKTVKSIQPGVYGIVTVGKIMSHGETVQIDLDKISKNFGATAEELESAAKTFMELAEYLRGEGMMERYQHIGTNFVTVTARPGSTIENAAKDAVDLSNRVFGLVTLKFNGRSVECFPFDSQADVVQQYFELVKK